MDSVNRRELLCRGTHPCYQYEYTDGGWGNNTRIREVDNANRRELIFRGTYPCYQFGYTDGDGGIIQG